MRNMNLQQYYCIKCGQPIQFEWDEKLLPTQCKCINLECVEFNKPWDIADHKDNQAWAVRHIRQLEQKVAELEAKLNG